MRIGIVGHGYVGSAIAIAHKDDEIFIRDPKLTNSATIEDLHTCQAVYICVPSPSTEDGYCDTSILENTLIELALPDCILIISKVTAPPSVYEKLKQKYPKLVYCPEFLTAANNIEDYKNSKYVVLGGDYSDCSDAASVIGQGIELPLKNFMFTDIKTAALYKYMMNCYLAMKVSFMNDFKTLADAEEISFENLTALTKYDDRIGSSHMCVPGPDGHYGWGGGCFPKDISAIIKEAIDLNVDFELMDRVASINKKHRRKTNE